MTKEEIIQAIETMSVLELSELVKALEEKFGVSASAAPVMMAAMPGAGAAAAPAETGSSRETGKEFRVLAVAEGQLAHYRHSSIRITRGHGTRRKRQPGAWRVGWSWAWLRDELFLR